MQTKARSPRIRAAIESNRLESWRNKLLDVLIYDDLKAEGLSAAKAARRLGRRPATIWKWSETYRRSGFDAYALAYGYHRCGRKGFLQATGDHVPIGVLRAVEERSLEMGKRKAWLSVADDLSEDLRQRVVSNQLPPSVARLVRTRRIPATIHQTHSGRLLMLVKRNRRDRGTVIDLGEVRG